METSRGEKESCRQYGTVIVHQKLCEKDVIRDEFENNNKPTNQPSNQRSQTIRKLYVSRALAAVGDRIWAFSLGVFINKLYPDSLRIVALYGFVVSVSLILCGASVGRWIDKNRRWFAAKVCLLVENLLVTLAYIILVFYYTFWTDIEESRWMVIASVILISIFANFACVGCKIIIERDWIVVVTAGDEIQLAGMNAVFTTIDLTALVLSPMFSGFLFHLANQEVVALVIGIWNTISIFMEYYLLKSICNAHPELAMKKDLKPVAIDTTKKRSKGCMCGIPNPWIYMRDIKMGWKLYMNHNIRNAGLGLAFLYMTVLGFDNITYGFCLSQCVTEGQIGILVGASALIGILGSSSFPYLRKKFGLARTGIIGMVNLIIADMLCVTSIWLNGSPFDPHIIGNRIQMTDEIDGNYLDQHHWRTPSFVETNSTTPSYEELSECRISSYLSITILLSGILLAKFGLWISDLTITQVIQEEVEEEHRGVINGVQNSLNSLMDTMKFTLVISLPGEKTFGFLIMASFVSIVFGAISYTNYAVHSIQRKRAEDFDSEECDEKQGMLMETTE